MTPMATAAHGEENADGGVRGASGARIPLNVIEISGLPHLALVHAMATTAPADAASSVFTATTAIRRSVAPNVDPGLNPIHPKVRTSVPMTAYPRLCPGNAFGVPSLLNFPILGPRIMASARAAHPPVECTTPDPAKSTAPLPSLNIPFPSWDSQPPPHIHMP